jgi:hypothetical protein
MLVSRKAPPQVSPGKAVRCQLKGLSKSEFLMIAACRKIFFALLAAGATFLCVSAYAQSGGATLQGTVSDSSGAVVPNAHIHILAELTGVAHDVDSNNTGFYSAPNLNAGRYKLTVTAQGFATKVENDVVLTVGSVHELDVPLSISSSDISVTVETSTNAVNPVDTSVQGIVDGKQTRDLPLNSRDWTTLATLNSRVSQVLTQFAGAATATTRLSRGLGCSVDYWRQPPAAEQLSP